MLMTITTAGVAKAGNAHTASIKLKITEFAVGEKWGYVPNKAQTALRGTEKARKAPINFRVDGEGHITYVCRLDATVGTFNFGELGLYLDDGTLFAIGVSSNPIYKLATSGAGAGNIIDIEASIFLDTIDITSIIEFPTNSLTVSQILTEDGVHHLERPQSMDCNAYFTRDRDDFDNLIYAFAKGSNQWHFPTHLVPVIRNGIVSGNDAGNSDPETRGLSIKSAQFDVLNPGAVARGKYIIQFTDNTHIGECRLIETVNTLSDTITWLEAFPTAVPVSSHFDVYRSLASILTEGVPAKAIIAESPPTGATHGQLWWESDSGNFWIYYGDGDSYQWVCIGNTATPFNSLNYLSVEGGGSVNGIVDVTKLGIGTSSPMDLLHLQGTSTAVKARFGNTNNTLGATVGVDAAGNLNLDTANGKLISFSEAGLNIFTVAEALVQPRLDNIVALGDSTHKWKSIHTTSITSTNPVLTPSDKKLKHNIQSLGLGLDFVNRLIPVSFNWKTDPESADPEFGFIAQEVIVAAGGPCSIVKKNEDGYLQLAYASLAAPLVKAVQELSAEVEALKAEIDDLKHKT